MSRHGSLLSDWLPVKATIDQQDVTLTKKDLAIHLFMCSPSDMCTPQAGSGSGHFQTTPKLWEVLCAAEGYNINVEYTLLANKTVEKSSFTTIF